MNLLLDTHTLIWWLETNLNLSPSARAAIAESRNRVFLSAVVVWEIAIKKSLKKLNLPDDLNEIIIEERFLPLPITLAHALAVEHLPRHHNDPFDRMLVAQAQVEGLTLVTRDPRIRKYEVEVIVA